MKVAPDMVRAPTRPVKPDREDPLLRVRRLLLVPVLPIVSVPVPERVPFRVISALVSPPVVGLFPSGNEQLLFTVLRVEPVWAKVTRLKLTLLQAKVPSAFPSNVTVPPLAVKVVPELMVKEAPTVIVLEGAVKTALEERVNPSISNVV